MIIKKTKHILSKKKKKKIKNYSKQVLKAGLLSQYKYSSFFLKT